jgi:hypothetical protein
LQGSGYGTKKTPEQEVNHSIFSTVSAGTAGIFLKMYVGIRHLFYVGKTPRQLSPDSSQYVNGELINCGPIDQIVRIDELPEKARPIDQLRQLINGAQQRL